MADALEPSVAEDDLHVQRKPSGRCRRKSGYSNIFSGVNLHQLHRLFRTAGDRNAEHRAKLVWGKMDAGVEGAEGGKQEEEEWEDEAGLAQALVGLRVRARTKAGIRVEGHKEQRWLRAAGYLRVEEPLPGYGAEDEEADAPGSPEEFQPRTEEDLPEDENPSRAPSWRPGGARDSDRYLHRILH